MQWKRLAYGWGKYDVLFYSFNIPAYIISVVLRCSLSVCGTGIPSEKNDSLKSSQRLQAALPQKHQAANLFWKLIHLKPLCYTDHFNTVLDFKKKGLKMD